MSNFDIILVIIALFLAGYMGYHLKALLIVISDSNPPEKTTIESKGSFLNGSVVVTYTWNSASDVNSEIKIDFLSPGLYNVKFNFVGEEDLQMFLPKNFSVNIETSPQSRIFSYGNLPKHFIIDFVSKEKSETGGI